MVRTTEGRLAEGSVYFDVDVCEVCEVLLVTPHTGIAIKPLDVETGTYKRVGAVSVDRIFDSEIGKKNLNFVNCDNTLSTSCYPGSIVITLL
jgi:hypothetical protein